LRADEFGVRHLPLAEQPELPRQEKAERNLVFGGPELGRKFDTLPVMAGRGGVLAPPSFQHGQATQGDRQAPPLPQRGEDARRGQEILLRLDVLAAVVDRHVPAQDPGGGADPRLGVSHRLVEHSRRRQPPPGGKRPEEGPERADQPEHGLMGVRYRRGEVGSGPPPVLDPVGEGGVHGQQPAHRIGHGEPFAAGVRPAAGYVHRHGDQLGTFHLHAAQRPVPAERAGQRDGGLAVTGRDGTADRPVQVVLVVGQLPQPVQLLGAEQVILARLGQLGEVPRVRLAQLVMLPRLGQPFLAVGPDYFEHPVARPVRALPHG